MFSLYFDKDKVELVIGKADNLFKDGKDISGIVKYNDCYYIGPDRKELREFAEKMRLEWLKEAEERVETLRNFKIKNKY